jgi:sugar phosphate isomerase/epimerase
MPDHRLEAFFASERAARSNTNTTTSNNDNNNVKVPLAYASCSIGCKDEHTLPKKLSAIAAAGFTAIELSMPDILAFAKMHLRPHLQGDSPSNDIDPKDYDSLVTAAKTIKAQCDAKELKVLILQPFANFEGWPAGSSEREDAFDRLRGWMRIMEAAGTDMLQVGSSDSPASKIGTDRSRFVSDLRELADMLATKGFRCAYENWCWSTHAPDWADVWDICQQVDRPNFGLCLDTFQSAGGEWADPTTASGMVEDGRRSAQHVEEDWKASCEKLAKTIPADKIFFLQISDAYRMNPPLENKEDENGMRPRARWSSAYRPLPFQGYLPCVDFTRAVLKTGFRGWFSYEVFDQGPDGKGKDYDMGEFAKSAMETQERLIRECGEV